MYFLTRQSLFSLVALHQLYCFGMSLFWTRFFRHMTCTKSSKQGKNHKKNFKSNVESQILKRHINECT